MVKDNLGNRMKTYYEEVSKTKLTRRMPVIIRLDGKAFHTFTRGFKKPFDDIFMKTMQDTMKYLCENIQGCVLGYTQSDEITLVLVDYNKLDTSAWFDYEVQKMTSISASMATLAFNRNFSKNLQEAIYNKAVELGKFGTKALAENYYSAYIKALNKGAVFDSRVFNIPKEEVTNCVLWRQKDAERNSILSVAQANYSQKELEGKSCKELVAKLETEKDIIWGNLPTPQKRGTCCIKDVKYLLDDGQVVENNSQITYKDRVGQFYFDTLGFYFYPIFYLKKIDGEAEIKGEEIKVKEISKWILDYDIPRFVDEGRFYIENLINVGE